MQDEGKDLESSNCTDETSETRQITGQPENNWTTLILILRNAKKNPQNENIPYKT